MQTYEDRWDTCLNLIKEHISDVAFSTYFLEIKFVSFNDNTLILKSPLPFYIDHIKKKYLDILEDACKVAFNSEYINIEMVLEDDIKHMDTDMLQDTKIPKKDNNLNNKHLFDNFVIGESNRLAHAASFAVAEEPGIYNPLFLYGDVGLGKTHLMHAIANYILDENPSAKVLYASCEKFTNELITSIKEQKNKDFRQKYRKIDVLLIDDIQFIVDKTQTQEEFFHTFNDLKDSGKQIIISSDRPPNEIETLTERLRSRFSGGLIADIKTPNFETRTAILEKKAESLNISIPKEVSQFIAKSVKSNIRELEGALTRVLAYSKLIGEKLSVELAESALKDIIQDTNISLNSDYILDVVSSNFNISVDDIKSKKRNKPITNARQIYMYLAREILNYSLIAIGKTIERDHSTVIHGIEKVENNIKEDKNFENTINTLRGKIIKK